MTRRPKCGWIAAAILTLLAGAAQDGAQAAVLSGMEPLAPHSSTVCAVFRLPGHTIGRLPGGRPPGVGKRPGPISKGAFEQDAEGSCRHQWDWPHHGHGRPPQAPSDVAPLRPGRGPRSAKAGPRSVVVPRAVAAVTAFAILGAGGAPRQPIAPRYTGEPGQRPAQVAAALLDGKRHRPRELLVEVSDGTSGEVKEALARDYGAEIAEVGTVELAGVRIWHLTLGPAGNLR